MPSANALGRRLVRLLGLRGWPRRSSSRKRWGQSRLRGVERLETRCLLSIYLGPGADYDSVQLGPQTGFFDQPYIEIELVEVLPNQTTVGLGPYQSGFGIYPYNRLLLDTGANSIMVVSDAAADLIANGYRTEGTYTELGVAGEHTFGVSAPYQINFRGSDNLTHTLPQTANQNRILSDPAADLGGLPASFGGIPGIVGMPVMVGRVTTLDMSAWDDVADLLELQPMGVTFADAVPASSGHRYTVPVDTRVRFDPGEGLPPVWAPVPFLTVVAQNNGVRRSGGFLLDTGAQMTVMSSDLAFALGLDTNGNGSLLDEAIRTETVGGVGGMIDAPVLLIDQLRIPTLEGPELVWLDPSPEPYGLEVLVLDIAPGIEGVLGVDLLTSGLNFEIDLETLEIAVSGAPYFERIHMDFRTLESGTGTLYFDLHPTYDQVTADPVGVVVTETGAGTSVTEGGATDTYEVMLGAAPTADVTVTFQTGDQLQPIASITFTTEDWYVPRVVTVEAVDDGLREGPHLASITHTVTSADARYDGIAVLPVVVDITDNHPVAVVTASAASAAPLQEITFDASGSTHGRPDRHIVSYQWDFGDGQTTTTEQPVVVHAFENFGQYTVSLTVVDDNSPPKTDTAQVVVAIDQGNQEPVAVAGGPYTVAEGQSLRLDASASYDPDAAFGDRLVDYGWDLDNDGLFDDAVGGDPIIEVPWDTVAGLFPVGVATPITLRVTDRLGATGQAQTTVTVIAPQASGRVELLELPDQDPSAGPLWYRLETSRPGWLTGVGTSPDGSGAFRLALFDAALGPAPLATSVPEGSGQRLDWLAPGAGQTYYLRLEGTTADADLKILNLVQPAGQRLNVFGTAGADEFVFAASPSRSIRIAGVDYDAAGASLVFFHGAAGDDTAALGGTEGFESALLRPGAGSLIGSGFAVHVVGTEEITALAQGGADRVQLYDSPQADRFEAQATEYVKSGPGYVNRAYGFAAVAASSRGDTADVATLYAASPGDIYLGTTAFAMLRGPGRSVLATGFPAVVGLGMPEGNNAAFLFDSPERDVLEAGAARTTLVGGGRSHQVDNFGTVYAYSAAGGQDEAHFQGTAQSDTFVAYPTWAMLAGNGFVVRAAGFRTVTATSPAGSPDLAALFDSASDDALVAQGTSVSWSDGLTYAYAIQGFSRVIVQSRLGGYDTAELRFSSSADTFAATPEASWLVGPTHVVSTSGFEEVTVHGTGSGLWERGSLFDSEGDDLLTASGNEARLQWADGRLVRLLDLTWVRAFSTRGGTDRKHIEAHDFVLALYGPWVED